MICDCYVKQTQTEEEKKFILWGSVVVWLQYVLHSQDCILQTLQSETLLFSHALLQSPANWCCWAISASYLSVSSVWTWSLKETDELLRAFTVTSSRLSVLQNFRHIQSWMYLSWTSTAEGHNSGRGSGFQAYILKLMLLNLYMCQQLWFNRVTTQLALNKHSTMLPCLTLLIDMTLGFLACQGDSTNAIWAYLGVSAMLRLTPCLQFVSTGHLEYKIRPLSNRQTFIFYCDFLKTIKKN